jgi:hypothetical protein
VKSIEDVYHEYKTHPESKSAGPNGNPCGPYTRGPLYRRHIYAAYVRLIGKEANKIEEVEHERIDEWAEVREEYQDPKLDPIDDACCSSAQIDAAQGTRTTRASRKTLGSGRV